MRELRTLALAGVVAATMAGIGGAAQAAAPVAHRDGGARLDSATGTQNVNYYHNRGRHYHGGHYRGHYYGRPHWGGFYRPYYRPFVYAPPVYYRPAPYYYSPYYYAPPVYYYGVP